MRWASTIRIYTCAHVTRKYKCPVHKFSGHPLYYVLFYNAYLIYLEFQEVLKLTKSTLSGESDKYTYSIDEDQLVWKKVAGLAKMTLVKIELTEKPFLETQKSFFEFLINENKQLQSTNDNLQRKQESLVLSLKQSHATLEVFEKEKNEMEERLYSKFLPILNSKKDEILRLKNNFSALEDDNDYGDETDEDEDVLDSKRQKS